MEEKYTRVMRALHWAMALMIIGMIASGWYMTGLSKEESIRGQLYGLHKSFGMILLGLIALRIITRIISAIPPLPDTFSKQEKTASHAGHFLLYLFMVTVPLSGYLMSSFFGKGVAVFGMALPNFLPKNMMLAGITHNSHAIMAYILTAVVVIHILAVIKHHLIDKKPILKRML